jgi:transcriptional regulator GlxA family with amidase domain
MTALTLRPTSHDRFLRELERVLSHAGIATSAGPYCTLDVSPRIRRVQDFVEVNVGAALCLDDLAEVAGLSRYHFGRVFRDEVGQTPWAFVRETRVERAKELLAEGHSPAEAAHEAGFFDQSHLTRVLRTIDGRTPGEVRDAGRAGDAERAGSEGGEENRTIVQDP